MEKPSESLANVVDAESSFEVISADCSVDNIEEASESPEALESFRVFHFKSESGEDSSSSESPESPKPSEELVKSEEVSSFKVKGTPDSSNTENRVRQLARKFQKLAGRVDKFEAERNAQNHRPILEEISGTWKLSSKELCDKDTPLPTGPIFKIKAIGNRIDIFNIDKSNHMMLRRTALITSKQSTPTEYHDFVDDNQWFTVVCKEKKSSDSSVKRIVNGQLWIEFQSGGKCVKHVFERTQDVKVCLKTTNLSISHLFSDLLRHGPHLLRNSSRCRSSRRPLFLFSILRFCCGLLFHHFDDLAGSDPVVLNISRRP